MLLGFKMLFDLSNCSISIAIKSGLIELVEKRTSRRGRCWGRKEVIEDWYWFHEVKIYKPFGRLYYGGELYTYLQM